MSGVLEMARRYTRRGWRVVPIPYRTKRPVLEGWQQLRLGEEELERYFGGSRVNVGLLCGEPSGGLADVDCDCAEAVEAARAWLPATGMRCGRRSRPGSHWWYEVTDAGVSRTCQFHDVTESGARDGEMLIELRFTGGQTLVPPSLHPDGEVYMWEEDAADLVPGEIEGQALLRAVKWTAATALLARHWRAEGVRHKLGLALAGTLLRGGMEVEAARRLVGTAAMIAGHRSVADRVKSVQDTWERLEAGDQATGLTALREFLPEGVIGKLGE